MNVGAAVKATSIITLVILLILVIIAYPAIATVIGNILVVVFLGGLIIAGIVLSWMLLYDSFKNNGGY